MNSHIDTELLLNYSNGNVEPALSLAIALHQKQCKPCRQKIAAIESSYGQNLELSEASRIENNSFERLTADLDKLPTSDNGVSKTSKSLYKKNIDIVDFGEDDTLSYAIAAINRPLFNQLSYFN